jgi:cytochrome c biogenesis protein CcdA/thiol-disulfide isomerase/thioredoxin
MFETLSLLQIIQSFFFGVLTVLAPCVFPLLPVIIGSALGEKDKHKPYLIISGLAISIILFTLLLKVSVSFISIPPEFWKILSGSVLIFFGLTYIFHKIWDKYSLKMSSHSDKMLDKASKKEGWFGSVLTGAALGPVFSSCSPTYANILTTTFPVSFSLGLIYIVTYTLGLAAVLLLIALFGRRFTNKIKGLTNPNGIFRKTLGIIFIVIGLFIITGFDKKIEIFLGNFLPDTTKFEQGIIKSSSQQTPSQNNSSKTMLENKTLFNENYPAPELKGLQSWINSDPKTLADLKGKVVLIDFWTYSCINCQRTLPFVTKWYDTYKDQGFVVLGIHAPEFSFEKEQKNVENAVKEANIRYPVALDNNFATWKNYNNQFWPAEYLVDKDGIVRRTHFGEGKYEETEDAIRALLAEKSSTLPNKTTFSSPNSNAGLTKETYFGYSRGERFENANEFKAEETVNYSLKDVSFDSWSLGGSWKVTSESIESQSNESVFRFKFNAAKLFLVMSSSENKSVIIENTINKGSDVNDNNSIKVFKNSLYNAVSNSTVTQDQIIEIKVPKGVKLYAATFG